ncbi:hypothetical protein MU852_07880 [Brevundimonas albigilva]|uniref:Transmembrane protein n=1 Tax=Brevundimonas albigilva TaxID=1312364 RepID=A0ABY4SN38_9CAUL|nr:hypothetical protein [Brevundimonas albigilva]UQV19639.1 hypothetical protein MU852_07880 [Brevundimonas albigilva]URI15334.1 hypothetical protein M8231_16340 [Brevundimonas albigilva]
MRAYCWIVALFVMVIGLGLLPILATMASLNCYHMGKCSALVWRFFGMATLVAAGFAALGCGLMKLIRRPQGDAAGTKPMDRR